jgi:hypothetical protein
MLYHQLSNLKIFEKFKAGLLCGLMLLATTPSLHALTQCATPQETNCTVTVGSPACGNLGVFPCWIHYDAAVQDSTPGATIYYTVYCDGSYLISGSFSTHGDIIIQENYGDGQMYPPEPYPPDNCYGGSLTGTMYATAPGYSQSNPVGLSF